MAARARRGQTWSGASARIHFARKGLTGGKEGSVHNGWWQYELQRGESIVKKQGMEGGLGF